MRTSTGGVVSGTNAASGVRTSMGGLEPGAGVTGMLSSKSMVAIPAAHCAASVLDGLSAVAGGACVQTYTV